MPRVRLCPPPGLIGPYDEPRFSPAWIVVYNGLAHQPERGTFVGIGTSLIFFPEARHSTSNAKSMTESHTLKSVAQSRNGEKLETDALGGSSLTELLHDVYYIELHVLLHMSGAACLRIVARFMQEVCTSGLLLRSCESFHSCNLVRAPSKGFRMRWNRWRDQTKLKTAPTNFVQIRITYTMLHIIQTQEATYNLDVL